MPITTLRITDFRNMIVTEMSPNVLGLNVISGENGSGKTSVLEAIHYLGSGKSFRCSASDQLVRHQTEKFSVFSQIVRNDKLLPIGIERTLTGDVTLRVAENQSSSIAELAQLLPMRLINSQSHHLFESGPAYRRKYLDWGLFYHFEQFLPTWRQFERALKQRNAVLKLKQPKRELDPWTDEFVKHAEQLDGMRQSYITLLTPIIAELCQELLALPDLELHYSRGWETNEELAKLLAANYPEDYRLGATQLGPHRADLDITTNGTSTKHFLSRGQQKLLICAMILAQGILYSRHMNKSLIYLVDDLPSELDVHSQSKLVSLLTRQHAQIYITAIETDIIYQSISRLNDVPVKVFHVEHGKVRSE